MIGCSKTFGSTPLKDWIVCRVVPTHLAANKVRVPEVAARLLRAEELQQ